MSTRKTKNNERKGNYKNKHVDSKDLHRIFRNKKIVIEIKNTIQEFNNRLINKPGDLVIREINLTYSPRMHTWKIGDWGYKRIEWEDTARNASLGTETKWDLSRKLAIMIFR